MRKRIFFIGLAGAGMRGLAAILKQDGAAISGTDTQFEMMSQDQRLRGYQLAPETEALELLKPSELVIYSDAVGEDHPLRRAAVALNIPTQPYQQALGDVARQFENVIAVAGTHGKSSTTAFLGHILVEAGLDPTVLLGATVPTWEMGNARVGTSHKYFVVEADEYREHFLTLKPTHLILVSVDWDHPDYFDSLDEVVAAYARLTQSMPEGATIVTSATLHERWRTILPWPEKTMAVPSATEPLPLSLPGEHMQANANLALAMANALGVPRKEGIAALANFPGLGRRFEMLGQFSSLHIISDYGHHPAEIAATIQGARAKFPDKKILAVIEPHTELRLAKFLPEYASALAAADGVLVAPIYRARQNEPSHHDSAELFEAIQKLNVPVFQLNSLEQLSAELKTLAPQFDIALAFTAGELDWRLRQIITVNKD